MTTPTPSTPDSSASPPSTSVVATRELVLPGRSGLHARPAARVVEIAKRYASVVTLVHGETSASAKDLLDVLYLAAPAGATVVVSARGFDAVAAVESLGAYLTSLGDEA